MYLDTFQSYNKSSMDGKVQRVECNRVSLKYIHRKLICINKCVVGNVILPRFHFLSTQRENFHWKIIQNCRPIHFYCLLVYSHFLIFNQNHYLALFIHIVHVHTHRNLLCFNFLVVDICNIMYINSCIVFFYFIFKILIWSCWFLM